MLDLFNQYKNKADIKNALLIGRNLFNHHPDSKEIFSAYFNFLCQIIELAPMSADKQYYAEQADVALSIYSENATLTEQVLSEIQTYQDQLAKILKTLHDQQVDLYKKQQEEIKSKNREILNKLNSLKSSIRAAASQDELSSTLQDISAQDTALNKELFTEPDERLYEELTQEHARLISEKMEELQYKENLSYNQQAAKAFKKAFDAYRADEDKYNTIHENLYTLVSTTLFAFNSSKLFNETLMYYNHVYAYIFSKLDDEGKFALTRYAIECERK